MGFLESSKLCLPNNTLGPWTYALTVCCCGLAPAVKALKLLCLCVCIHTLCLGMPPQILQFPNDMKIRAGERVSLLCRFTGAPPINATWLKFRKPVSILHINQQCFNKPRLDQLKEVLSDLIIFLTIYSKWWLCSKQSENMWRDVALLWSNQL